MTTPLCEVCALFAHERESAQQLLGRWLCQGHVALAHKMSRENPTRQVARLMTHRNGDAMTLPIADEEPTP